MEWMLSEGPSVSFILGHFLENEDFIFLIHPEQIHPSSEMGNKGMLYNHTNI